MTSPGGDTRQVKIVVAADVAAAIRGLTQVSNAAGNVGGSAQEAQKKTNGWVEAFKTGIGVLGVSTGWDAVKSGFQRVMDQGMSFEQSMNTLSAVTGANADRMRELGDRAKQLGNDITIPGASAGTAAEAMAELAKGGLTVDETMKAASGTLRLAAAAQIDGADAAQIQANALNAFRLGANQADHVADLLANSANAASGEVTDMASALQQSATVAAGFGISVDDSATTLALFAKNGVLGSDAGTSFKTMLSALASPTEAQSKALDALNLKVYDANGNFVGMQSVTQQLADAHAHLTTEQYNAAASTAFGTDAIRAANILGQEGTQGWNDMATAVGKAGGAQELAAAQSQGFTGALDRFNNAVDNAALALYEGLSPAMSTVMDFGATAFGWLGDAVGWMSDLPAPVWAGVTALGAMILLKGPLNSLFLQAISGYTRMALAVQGASFSFAGIATAAKGALAAIGGPFGLAVIGVTTALSFFASSTDDAAGSQEDFAGALDQTTGKLNDQAAATISSKVASSGLGDQYKALGGDVSDLVDAIGGIPEAQDRVKATLDAARDAATDAGGAYTNAGAAIAAGGGAMTLSNDELAASTEALSGKLASIQGTGDLYNQLLASMSGAQAEAKTNAEGLTGELGKAGDATGKAGDAADKATDKTTPFADALKDIRSAASEADAASQFLNITLLEMAGNQVPAEQKARANAAAMREVGQSARDLADANDTVSEKQAKLDELTAHLGTTLDGQAESATNAAVTQRDVDAAARDLADAQAGVQSATDKQKDALDKAAESARQMTADARANAIQQGDLKGAVDAAVQTMAQQREAFIQSAIQAGYARDEAEKLADAQGLIPADVRTAYTQEGLPDAISEVQRLRQEIANLPDSKIVKVAVESGDIVYTTSSGNKMMATGGMVNGPGTGTSDSIPARLSDGEFVSTAATVSRPGNRAALDFMHAGGSFAALGFAQGGIVDTNKIQIEASNGNLVDTGWMEALDKAAVEKAKKFAESGFGLRQAFLNAVASKMGSAYVWGAAGPDVFDCSGLVSWALNAIGAGVGRLTAQGFNSSFAHVGMPGKPGDLATFDTGRLPGQAGHIGVIMDPAKGLMMHTDGAGPARVSDYKSRDGGPLSIVDVLSSKGAALAIGFGGPNGAAGDLPASASGGGINQWVGTVLQALAMTGQPASYSAYVLNQMRTESSGNPFVINNYDSNAARGTPSKGLMQVIDPTFRAYALPGYNSNIYDPLSNIIASIRYVLARYGSIPAGMRGVAYDTGGIWPDGTMGWNTSGGPEYVLKPWQWAAAQSAIQHVTNNAGNTYSGQQGGIQVGQINNYSQGDVIGALDWFQARSA